MVLKKRRTSLLTPESDPPWSATVWRLLLWVWGGGFGKLTKRGGGGTPGWWETLVLKKMPRSHPHHLPIVGVSVMVVRS